jgi:hypothetical protein
MNINDANLQRERKGPMEAANAFALRNPNFRRTDWCARQYMLSQTPNGWFYREA